MRLSLAEYFPLILTIALWALIVVMIGHADTVRLLAATVAMRAVQMLTRLSTPMSLRVRLGAPRPIRRQAKRFALAVQLAAFAVNVVLVVLFVLALDAIGQQEIAMFLPLIAVGLPVRVLRNSDTHTNSPYFRLAMAGGGLAAVAGGWLAGLGPVGVALAFGAREWIAYAVIRWWPKAPHVSERPVAAPLGFAEVARNTAISGRRLLTYRISKVALTLFGPVGNVAARTGRGLNWHHKAEPFLPHRLSGFILFALAAIGGALFLAVRSGEPLAMVGAAGLTQLAAIATNIAMLWHYLPDRADPNLVLDDDEED